jgi:serine/threonine-protein kinase
MSSPPRDPWNLSGVTIDGRYRVSAIAAEGGTGRVYRAEDLVRGGLVALKVLKPPVGSALHQAFTITDEFLREREALARVDHPAIVRSYGQGELELRTGRATVYLALEWVDGVGLDQWLRGRGRLAPTEAVAVLAPVFEALAAAHRVGVAHRDLKPANVMIEARGERARLLDFGIAKLMEPDDALGESTSLTLSQSPSFSPAYAAPEQASGAKTGPWTDVHAMGLLLTELLIGERPYQGVHLVDLLREVTRADRPTPARFGVDVGPLEEVLARALASRAQARYANVEELWAAVRAAVAAPEPAAPAPTPPTAPTRGFPVDIALGAGVGVVLAVAMAVALLR